MIGGTLLKLIIAAKLVEATISYAARGPFTTERKTPTKAQLNELDGYDRDRGYELWDMADR
jgi:hypothetical protein